MNSSNPTTIRSVPLRTNPNSWPLWRTNESSGLDAPPGSYVASRNSDVLVCPEHEAAPTFTPDVSTIVAALSGPLNREAPARGSERAADRRRGTAAVPQCRGLA
jgi:hypothetical protein